MGAAKRLRDVAEDDLQAVELVTGVMKRRDRAAVAAHNNQPGAFDVDGVNFGTGDVRGLGTSALGNGSSARPSAYDDPPGVGDGTEPKLNGIAFDPESSVGNGKDTPLGYSERASDGTVLVGPSSVSAASGGAGLITMTDTEEAGGGSVFYSIENVDDGTYIDLTSNGSVTEGVDANGDATFSGIPAGDYRVYAFTQTTDGRVSRGVLATVTVT